MRVCTVDCDASAVVAGVAVIGDGGASFPRSGSCKRAPRRN